MNKIKEKQYYDLSAMISEDSITFPGDPQYVCKSIYSLEEGSEYHLNEIHLGNHTGTHIDFPAHVIKDGKTSNDFSIDKLIGYGLIIEVPDQEKTITKEFIKKQHIQANDFIFFKTSNSKIDKNGELFQDYVYIELEASKELLKKGAKVIGIDYISVDKFESKRFACPQTITIK